MVIWWITLITYAIIVRNPFVWRGKPVSSIVRWVRWVGTIIRVEIIERTFSREETTLINKIERKYKERRWDKSVNAIKNIIVQVCSTKEFRWNSELLQKQNKCNTYIIGRWKSNTHRRMKNKWRVSWPRGTWLINENFRTFIRLCILRWNSKTHGELYNQYAKNWMSCKNKLSNAIDNIKSI